MYQLGAQLGVTRVDTVANDATDWAQGEDAPARCPIIVAEVITTDRGDLDARALRMTANAPAPAAPATTPAPATSVAPAVRKP